MNQPTDLIRLGGLPDSDAFGPVLSGTAHEVDVVEGGQQGQGYPDLTAKLRDLARWFAVKVSASPIEFQPAVAWLLSHEVPPAHTLISRRLIGGLSPGARLNVGSYPIVPQAPWQEKGVCFSLPDWSDIAWLGAPQMVIEVDLLRESGDHPDVENVRVDVEHLVRQVWGPIPRRMAASWNEFMAKFALGWCHGRYSLDAFCREDASKACLLLALMFDPDFDGGALGLKWPWEDYGIESGVNTPGLFPPANGRINARDLFQFGLEIAHSIAWETKRILSIKPISRPQVGTKDLPVSAHHSDPTSDVRWMSSREMAESYSVDYDKLRGRIGRQCRRAKIVRKDVENPEQRMPRLLYRVSDCAKHIIELHLKSSD